MKQKRKNSKKYILIFIVIVIGMCLAIYNLISSIIKLNTNKISDNNENQISMNTISTYNKNKGEYTNTFKDVEENFIADKKIVPENYNMLVRLYDGNIDTSEIYEKIYNLVYNVIPNTYNNLNGKDETDIINYYNESKTLISNSIGIENETDYINFVKKVCEVANDNYISSSFDVKNFISESEYDTVDLDINYSAKNIKFKMSIINNIQENKPNIKFIIK